MDYQVLLYYNYTTIEDPEQFAKEHLAFCKSLNLKGRILVAKEGINGTLSGTIEETEKYMAMMHQDERFADTFLKLIQVKATHLRKCLFVHDQNLFL